MVRMAKRHGERIGRIGGQTPLDLKHAAHHVSHLQFVRTAETDHCELDCTRRVFGELDRFSDGREGRTTSLSQLQGTIDITTDEDLFDSHLGGRKPCDELTHTGMNTRQTRLDFKTVHFDATMGEAALRSGSNFDHSETGPSRAWVEPQNANRRGQVSRHGRWRRSGRRSGGLWIEGAPRLGAISRHASATPKKRLENQLRMILRNGDAPCKLPSLFPRR